MTRIALVKNALLGAAVFETYEQMLIQLSQDKDPEHDLEPDVYSKTSLVEHFYSGFCAGSVHGALSLTSDAMQTNYQSKQSRNGPRKQFNLYSVWVGRGSYTMHHALSHAVLFSSYEGSKRRMNFWLNERRKNLHTSCSNIDQEEFMIDTVYGDVFAIGIAGGIAGQVQTFVSHYSELWSDGMKKKQTNGETFKQSLKKYPLPSARSIVLSFPASAIGFVAFEFGKDMMLSTE